MALCIADCLFPRRLLTGLPRDWGFVLLEFLAMQLCPFPNNSWHCIRRLSVKQVSEMTRKELSQCGKMIEVIPIGFFHQSIVCLSILLPMSVYAVYNSPRYDIQSSGSFRQSSVGCRQCSRSQKITKSITLTVQHLRPKAFLAMLLTTKPLMRINGSGLQDTNLADTYTNSISCLLRTKLLNAL